MRSPVAYRSGASAAPATSRGPVCSWLATISPPAPSCVLMAVRGSSAVKRNDKNEDVSMNAEQQSRVVLITGAGGGLGPSIVRIFAEEGARLVLTSRRQQELEAVAETLGLDRERTLIVPANIIDPGAASNVVQTVYDRFGALDVVVHVAGGFKSGTSVPTTDPE